MKLKYHQIYLRAHNHKKRRVRKKYLNILLKIGRKEKYNTYEITIHLSDSFRILRFYGTEEEMKRLVDEEARAYCVRCIVVTHRGVKCYTKANLSYNFDEDSDDGYLDFYDIFPRFKKYEDSERRRESDNESIDMR